jgi:Fur family transcriptional regulator, ferric uptake regulator
LGQEAGDYDGDVSGSRGSVKASDQQVDEVLALVRERGGRVTSSRRLLLHALFDTPRHRTAEELATEVQRKAPDTHLSTIYRNLEELESLGVICHAHLGHGPAVYHLSTEAHSHLVCENCGEAFEAPDKLFNHLSRSIAAEYGFQINPHHFAILGLCQNCR